MSKLFEEAIADAKKLKEVAEENAKKAILESVTPQIREFIEEQLLEGDDKMCEQCGKSLSEGDHDHDEDDKEDDLNEEVYLDEGALASLVNLIGVDALDSLNESKTSKLRNAKRSSRTKKGERMSRKYYEVDLRALREAVDLEEEDFQEMEDVEEGDIDEELNELYEEFAHLLEQDEEEEAPEEDEDMEDMEDMEGGEGDMLSRDEVSAAIQDLIDDLDLDLGAGGADMAEPGAEGEEMEDEEMEFDLSGMGAEGEEGEDLNEVFEVDARVLRQEINRIKRLVREGKMDHHFGGRGGGKVGVDGAFGGRGKSKAGVNGAFGGGSYGKDPFVNPPQINKLNEAVRQLRRQNRAQAEKLNKYRGAVNSLREQLEDLNLFNAKLLYVNKLLQNKSLNESQKKSVIKALDAAKSLTEAKSLYKSLTETFSRGSRKTISESRVLGSSSRATTSSQSSATSTNSELGRWQRLAGL